MGHECAVLTLADNVPATIQVFLGNKYIRVIPRKVF